MIKTFFSHIFESIKSLKRNGWMTIASASAVTITLILVGIFMSIIFNATKLARDVEGNVTVSVFIDIGTSKQDIHNLKTKLSNLPNVESISYSNKDQQLKRIQKQMGSAWNLFEGDSNPLYDVYYIQAKEPTDTKGIAKQAEKMPNVFKADYGGVSSDKIFRIAATVRTWGLAAAILLLFVAVFLISNTIRITILSRKREIHIMRLVGAKNGFIRWPFFLEGAWIGLFGAIIPVVILTIGYQQFYNIFNPQLLRSNYSLLKPENFVMKIDVLMVFIGMLIGSLGSVISMRRFLKM
ncbi:permease-like cell division protein FtsX [Melissococcus plutonius]|uniref:Cell division protein FtsX n=1 Tax=Melissococcus plutonius TaxID=33970 RepID=A0A2Z5Y2M2_9ENTE|nr:permease-like cell division protein FtsX [Melissococcus plutonius]BAL62250.1 cell division protein FtsX [Melissococcus plutonius DAT561]MCV2498022.1 permease-like cell division protein FtsX [Melissococcus plutonius]MCV2501803.1 permease-like cell division protein FtsX [Melissococcus plutonius]MCV2505362.1 permease-like cell division protein FtsX [Melissococcus plutonius]MCV2506637.1 permease-like cell division protein FtsX [Melissococcus plutonius]